MLNPFQICSLLLLMLSCITKLVTVITAPTFLALKTFFESFGKLESRMCTQFNDQVTYIDPDTILNSYGFKNH
jgi:hypothetical protein